MAEFLGRLEAFVESVGNPPAVGCVVEIRNPRWISDRFLQTPSERGLGFFHAEQECMPSISELWERFGEKLMTADRYVYIRFLGERKRIGALTSTWDNIEIDQTAETREWVGILRKFLEQGYDVWAYFTNHLAGHAPGSIELLREMWTE